MLESNQKGYAVMSKDLSGISFESDNIKACLRYLRGDDVICELIPHVSGFSISFNWFHFYKWLSFKHGMKNILWIHWHYYKNHSHKTGKIIPKNEYLDKT